MKTRQVKHVRQWCIFIVYSNIANGALMLGLSWSFIIAIRVGAYSCLPHSVYCTLLRWSMWRNLKSNKVCECICVFNQYQWINESLQMVQYSKCSNSVSPQKRPEPQSLQVKKHQITLIIISVASLSPVSWKTAKKIYLNSTVPCNVVYWVKMLQVKISYIELCCD